VLVGLKDKLMAPDLSHPVSQSSVSANAVREKPAVSRATELELSRRKWPGAKSKAFAPPFSVGGFPGQCCPAVPAGRERVVARRRWRAGAIHESLTPRLSLEKAIGSLYGSPQLGNVGKLAWVAAFILMLVLQVKLNKRSATHALWQLSE